MKYALFVSLLSLKSVCMQPVFTSSYEYKIMHEQLQKENNDPKNKLTSCENDKKAMLAKLAVAKSHDRLATVCVVGTLAVPAVGAVCMSALCIVCIIKLFKS
jgi:hypothetical protein